MITLRILADVTEDRQVVLNLPPEVPLGKTELVIVVDSGASPPAHEYRSSLADWADEQAEHWGDDLRAEDVGTFTGRSL